MQCVAVRCSVLQYVAVCCSTLQCVAVRCSLLQYAAVCYMCAAYFCILNVHGFAFSMCYSVLQCATCKRLNVLQTVALNVLQTVAQLISMHNTLQCVAVRGSVLHVQYVADCCSAFQWQCVARSIYCSVL